MLSEYLLLVCAVSIAVVACILYKKYIGKAGDELDDDDDYPWER